MPSITYTTQTEELRKIQARITALVRGIQSRPENALDYGEALEFQLFQLEQTIERLLRDE